MIRKVQTPHAPAPGGHYAQAVIFRDLIFVSGQLPIKPHTGEKVLGDIEEQAQQVIANVLEIVQAGGGDLTTALKCTVFISDISLWGRFNAVFAAQFGEHKPARAVVPTRELHHGFLVEMDAIAAKIS